MLGEVALRETVLGRDLAGRGVPDEAAAALARALDLVRSYASGM